MLKGANIKFFAVGAIVLFAMFYYVSTHVFSLYGNKIVALNMKGHVIYVEVVSTEEKKALGLSGRKGICFSSGMLFEFQKAGEHAFWMKGMKFPLDFAWLADGVVVHIEKNIQPSFGGVLRPDEDANAVLELGAGRLEELGIMLGDRVVF